MYLSQEKLRMLYLKQNNINDFKIGDVVRYIPETIAKQRGFRVSGYMNLVENLLGKKFIVGPITYDSFGNYGDKHFHVMQHIGILKTCIITSSCFFMYDRKTKINNLLKILD